MDSRPPSAGKTAEVVRSYGLISGVRTGSSAEPIVALTRLPALRRRGKLASSFALYLIAFELVPSEFIEFGLRHVSHRQSETRFARSVFVAFPRVKIKFNVLR